VTSILLAGLSALVWGSADYCGGRATTRGNAFAVTVVSQLFGLPLIALAVVLIPGHFYLSDLPWALLAGAAGLVGIVLLYQGLASGAMAVVAPVTAVTGAIVPMLVGLATEQLPTAIALVGAVCAVIAIALVSLGPRHASGHVSLRIIGLALGAGALFGIFFSLLAQTHPDSGMWPLVSVRAASLALGLLIMARRRIPVSVPRETLGWVGYAGIGDIAANALFLLATRHGLLSVVAPVAALYPVSTVLLALTLDRERVRPIQIAGLGLAATALVLTAV
jgi:drug/metabolite transporter (DMT)-like permease